MSLVRRLLQKVLMALKFIWGNKQLQLETHTPLCCSVSPLPPPREDTHTQATQKHMNDLSDHRAGGRDSLSCRQVVLGVC